VKLESSSGNAGIQFRSKRMENGQARGYQAGIGKGAWGRLFHEQGRGKLDAINRGEKAVKPGQWNRYEILVVGPRLWIAINGKLSVAHTDAGGERAGQLALGILSGPAATVHFRLDKLVHDPKVELVGLTEKQLDAEIGNPTYSIGLVKEILADAQARGDARRGAAVFRSPTLACMSCHSVGGQGGTVGPDLSTVGTCLTADEIVESILWPKREVRPEYVALAVVTSAGKLLQGYKESETDKELVLREPGTKTTHRLDKSQIDDRREIGTLMPDGLAAAMTPDQRRDLVRFLLELGRTRGLETAAHAHLPATFAYDRAPLDPDQWPSWQKPVNRDRLYDYYAKEAAYFRTQQPIPPLLPDFPGLDGGKQGHWGNQNEQSWTDDRWNQADLGSVMCGVFRGAGVTVPRAVCVRLGEKGELAACFNPETLCYEALWQDGFVKFSPVRHGFMNGLALQGKPLERPAGKKPDQPFVYHGYYRHGQRVIFSYRLGDVEMLDSPWVEAGKFTRQVGPADKHPLAPLTRGGPAQWPQVIETKGTLGKRQPYAIDSITPPFKNPWNALLFFGGHDFLPDGTAFLCTMQGDVWRVEGLDDKLEQVRWRRIASGLHHALGLVVADKGVYVLGRDQITRLVDLNGDGETDFYECFSNAYAASPAGHDFICGLERDAAGHFYTGSGNQGLLRISPDGQKLEVVATGFRNPDGLCLLPDGTITVPCSEGEWTPASMICAVRPAKKFEGKATPPFFGYGGPRQNQPPELPLVYLPRGLDNSSGGQVVVPDARWGPLKGQTLHFSYGAGTHFLLLRDEVAGQVQGAVVPLAGEFLSGVHRGRFNPKDGQLYTSGMGGWGTYTVADGSFERVRYTGGRVQLPAAFHVHQNGVLVKFTEPVARETAPRASNHFAQCWNYRYSSGYGSPEFSARHPGTKGHDPLTIVAAHVLSGERSIFLEIPDLQPVNQLHLQMRVGPGTAIDIVATVHKLDKPFPDFPGYRPVEKVIAAHPILADLALSAKTIPNPWRKSLPNERALAIEADKNLTFSQRTLTVKAGESIRLTFTNPDVVPHNLVLIKPGMLERVGDLANKIVADPEAAVRHYVPTSPDVLVYTDIVQPRESFTIHFRAPAERGRYPFLCTFPGHWMVMNGQLIVE
jgi:putative heme-binding domain-containing protein